MRDGHRGSERNTYYNVKACRDTRTKRSPPCNTQTFLVKPTEDFMQHSYFQRNVYFLGEIHTLGCAAVQQYSIALYCTVHAHELLHVQLE